MSGVMMNFEFYYDELKKMPKPIMPSELPKVYMDINGLIDYATRKGLSPSQLSDTEKNLFIKGNYKEFREKYSINGC